MNKARILEALLRLKAGTAGFLQAKGMYVVLLASLAVVGGTALSAGRQAQQPPAATPFFVAATAAPVGQSQDESLAMAARTTPTPMPTPTPAPSGGVPATATPMPDFTQKPKPKATPKADTPRKASPPVDGAVIWRFARDELIYSATLKQWMTHYGVDVGAALHTPVRAIYGGVVEDVYEDDALGVTVLVRHGENMRTVYANLQPKPPVRTGQKVEAGDTVGLIGETAAAECEAPSHLHFEIWLDGACEDPEAYCLFQS